MIRCFEKRAWFVWFIMGLSAPSYGDEIREWTVAGNVDHSIHRDSLPSRDFIRLYGRLDNFFLQVKKEKKATVAFLGGSITAGNGWRDRVMSYLQRKYPATQWTFHNAGIPSLGSLPHAFRFRTDVLDRGNIDLLFIESAVNDLANGTSDEIQRRSIEGIIRHARKEQPAMDIVLMAFADEPKLIDYVSGKIPAEVRVHDDIAKHYHLPFINLAEEVSARINAMEFTWKDDFVDLHPSTFGHLLYFRTIRTMFEVCAEGGKVSRTKAAEIPPPLDPLNYSEGRYVAVSDANIVSGFRLEHSWTPADAAKTRPGFVSIPTLVGEQPGSVFEFTFQGDAVGIAIVSGPDAGVIRYTIDDGEEHTRDLYTQWSSFLHLPWFLLLGDNLGEGNHTLRVTLTDRHDPRSRGTSCRIVHFLLNGGR